MDQNALEEIPFNLYVNSSIDIGLPIEHLDDSGLLIERYNDPDLTTRHDSGCLIEQLSNSGCLIEQLGNSDLSIASSPEKLSINNIKMKPTSFQSKPETDVCLICQDIISDGHRITMCDKCKIYLHYHCQVEWLYYYNSVLNRNCCHCNQKWKADYSTIQIIKENN